MLGLTYLGLGLGYLPGLRMNRATIAFVGAACLVGLGSISLTQALRLNPIPYLLALAGATNLGSVATLSGNPQNILIGSFSGISYLAFAQALVPVALVGLLVQLGLLWWLYREAD